MASAGRAFAFGAIEKARGDHSQRAYEHTPASGGCTAVFRLASLRYAAVEPRATFFGAVLDFLQSAIHPD